MGSKIEIYINYIENSLFTYFKYLLGKSYKYSIVKIFITKYIEIRYYNNGIYRDKNLSDHYQHLLLSLVLLRLA